MHLTWVASTRLHMTPCLWYTTECQHRHMFQKAPALGTVSNTGGTLSSRTAGMAFAPYEHHQALAIYPSFIACKYEDRSRMVEET
jgi:hypothetical protein